MSHVTRSYTYTYNRATANRVFNFNYDIFTAQLLNQT